MSNSVKNTTPPIMQHGTMAQLKADLGEGTYQHLLGLFVDELTQLNCKLKMAVEHQQFKDINDATHILKNTAALYGAERLSTSASLVYQLKSNQQYIAQTQQLIDIINDTLTEYKAHINSIAE